MSNIEISLRIFGRDLTLACPPKEKENLIKAAKLLNEELDNINDKRLSLEKDIEKEILKAEEEINQLKTTSQEKVTKIAIETSSDLVKQLIGEDINKSSLSAIVEDLSKKEMEKHNGI